MMVTIYGWLAHMLPRRLVFSCLMRVVSHSAAMDTHRGLSRIVAHDLINEWREVCNGEERERR